MKGHPSFIRALSGFLTAWYGRPVEELTLTPATQTPNPNRPCGGILPAFHEWLLHGN
jgi:hypothetical protein